MKKFLTILISIVSLSTFAIAQEGNLGIFAGTSYYMGELNPRTQFYMPSQALGVNYLHNFNKRWAFKINFDYFVLRGNDQKSNNAYQNWRNYSFSNTVWDIGTQIELNFFDFQREDLTVHYFTPYISTGVYLTYIKKSQSPLFASIPIEIGVKYALTHKVTIGALWQVRYASSDFLDNLDKDNFYLLQKQRSNNPDTDWMGIAGVFLRFKIFEEEMPCPAYGGF